MPRLRQLPPVLLARAVWLRLRGRVHFPRDPIGDVVHEDHEDYEIFRKMVLDPAGDQPEHVGAVLDVRFRFARFSPAMNRRLSRIPMPFIAAQRGFRSKTWMLGRESGHFRGVYEWDSVEDAEDYWTSFPMRLMRRRAASETLTREIHPEA